MPEPLSPASPSRWPRRRSEADAVEHGSIAVGKGDVAEFQAALEIAQGNGMLGLAHAGLEFEEGHKPFERDGKLGDVDANAVELFEGRVEGHQSNDENGEVGKGAMDPKCVKEQGADAHGIEGLDDGVEHFLALDALNREVAGALARLEEGVRVHILQGISLGDADVLERFHGDAGLADVGGKIASGEFLDFFGDLTGWQNAEGCEGQGDDGEFPVDEEHKAKTEKNSARFLDQIRHAELEEVVQGRAVAFDPGDELAGGGFLEEIERERTDLAEGIVFDRVGDALAAPGHEIAAAVTEKSAQDDREGYEQKTADAPLPVERLVLDRQPGVDQDVQFLFDGGGLSLQPVDDDVFPLHFFGFGLAALFGDLLDVCGVVEPI